MGDADLTRSGCLDGRAYCSGRFSLGEDERGSELSGDEEALLGVAKYVDMGFVVGDEYGEVGDVIEAVWQGSAYVAE